MILFFLTGLVVDHVSAQPVLKKQMDPNEVVPVVTALGRITLINLPEPPHMVVAIDTAPFKIEVVENKIMIQPLDPKAATNLFVWTGAGRLNFDLTTRCGDAEFNHVLDYSEDASLREAAEYHRKELETLRDQVISEQKEKFLTSLLSSPQRVPAKRKSQKTLVLYFQEAIRMEEVTYLRYVLINDTDQPFTVTDPELRIGIILSDQDKAVVPPYGLQKNDAKLRKLQVAETAPPTLIEHRMQRATLLPGERTTGVLAMTFPSTPSGGRLLSVTFSGAKNGHAGASVVIDGSF